MQTHHFGVLIPATNTTCEIEYSRLLPPNLQVHVGRLGKGGDTPFSPSLDADLAYQSKMLGQAKVEVVALAQTSASLFDDGYDAKAKALMAEGAGQGNRVKLVSPSDDAREKIIIPCCDLPPHAQ